MPDKDVDKEALALLAILALAQADIDAGRVYPARESFARIRRRLKDYLLTNS